jgi:hypothetical protein
MPGVAFGVGDFFNGEKWAKKCPLWGAGIFCEISEEG